jgi:predicted DNA-binding ribbon-helix-helix protein
MLRLVSSNMEPIFSGSRLFPSPLVMRELLIDGRRVPVHLKPETWRVLREICLRERLDLHRLCARILRTSHPETPLKGSLSMFIASYLRADPQVYEDAQKRPEKQRRGK